MIEQLVGLKVTQSFNLLEDLVQQELSDQPSWELQDYRELAQSDQFASVENGQRLLVSRMFADFAYFKLSGKQQKDQILLSPARTFQFFQFLYMPNDLVLDDGLQEGRVMGVTTPDGLVIDCTGDIPPIVKACEYTLTRRLQSANEYLDKKVYGFGWVREEYPILFEDTDLQFVTPFGSEMARVINMGNLPRVKALQLPITYDRISEIVNDSLTEAV